MNNITYINESYFNDKDSEIYTDDIASESVDVSKDLSELMHLQDSKYNYIVDLIIRKHSYSDNNIMNLIKCISFSLNESFFINDYYLRPMIIVTQYNQEMNKKFIESIDWTVQNLSYYNIAKESDLKDYGNIHIVYAINAEFKNSKYLANLYYLILRSVNKYSNATFLNIHKNISEDLENHTLNYQFINLEDFINKDAKTISRAINNSTDDKYSYYNIVHTLYKRKYPIWFMKQLSYNRQLRDCFDIDEMPVHINISNINKEIFADLFFSAYKIIIYCSNFDIINDSQQIMNYLNNTDDVYFFESTSSELRTSGGFEDIITTNCWIGKTYYDSTKNEEFGICLKESCYKDYRLEVYDDEEDNEYTAKLIVIGMIMYGFKDLDSFIDYCRNNKLSFIYDILAWKSQLNKVEILRPLINDILNKLYN